MVVFFENVSWIALGVENDGVLYENPHVHIVKFTFLLLFLIQFYSLIMS